MQYCLIALPIIGLNTSKRKSGPCQFRRRITIDGGRKSTKGKRQIPGHDRLVKYAPLNVRCNRNKFRSKDSKIGQEVCDLTYSNRDKKCN